MPNTILSPLPKCYYQLKCKTKEKAKSINLFSTDTKISSVSRANRSSQCQTYTQPSRPNQQNSSHELLQLSHFYTEHFLELLCLQILYKDFRKWAIVWHLLCLTQLFYSIVGPPKFSTVYTIKRIQLIDKVHGWTILISNQFYQLHSFTSHCYEQKLKGRSFPQSVCTSWNLPL